MGMVKRHMEEVEDRGWHDVDTTICSGCVTDEALVEAIRIQGDAVPCNYCLETPTPPAASVPIEVVLKLVVDGLKLEYEDPVENMAWEGEYVGGVDDTWDLLWDLGVTEREDVHHALHDAIVTAHWCQREPYAASPTQALIWGWNAFREFVKHRRRFTFLAEDTIASQGAGEIPMHAMPAAVADSLRECNLITTLAPESEWWRLRPHPAGESYSQAADIGPAPDKVARDNRMTPKGIGAFYGASTEAGAIAEVAGYAKKTDHGSLGMFRTTVSLTVVDLRDLPTVPSLFDEDRRHLRAPIQFLREFVKDATKTSDPADQQNLDYVPTRNYSGRR